MVHQRCDVVVAFWRADEENRAAGSAGKCSVGQNPVLHPAAALLQRFGNLLKGGTAADRAGAVNH